MAANEQIATIMRAVASAQRSGAKQERERVAEIGGQEIKGSPLRWVELEQPPVVYFPDAHPRRKLPGAVLTVLFLLAFVALLLAGVSVSEADWLFLAIFGTATLVFGGAGIWFDLRNARGNRERRAGVERHGLYLTPDALILRTPGRTSVVARGDVKRFYAARISSASENGVRYQESVEVSIGGRSFTVPLQEGTHSHQRECCIAWLDGQWPVPLPPRAGVANRPSEAAARVPPLS